MRRVWPLSSSSVQIRARTRAPGGAWTTAASGGRAAVPKRAAARSTRPVFGFEEPGRRKHWSAVLTPGSTSARIAAGRLSRTRAVKPLASSLLATA